MFKIDPTSNRISRIQSKSFSELGFTERAHLQEWLANQPDAFGEELLIIQKEFDGFDETRERLDLLALDKDGNLVVIENKLDDSGRDVIWQALKYASYCSTLNKKQIVEIYQSYLTRYCSGGDATIRICEFLDVPDFEELKLNSGNGQRLMFVAANYRKEVTSTALWLLSHNIQVQCFKVTPYKMSDELFLNIEQIVPTPEVKELMIGINAKEADEKNTEVVIRNSHKLRLDFWQQALETIKDSPCDLFKNVNPTRDHWLCSGSGVSNCPFTLIFAKKEVRVELWFARPSLQVNKAMFDLLAKYKEDINNAFGDQLEWLRLDDKKSSRIQFSRKYDGYNRDNWPEMIEWLIHHIAQLEKALKQPLQEANQQLRNVSSEQDVN